MARRLRLIERRESLGLSQALVAEQLGRNAGTYRRWEWGDSTPQPDEWESLGRVLGGWTPAQVAVALADDGQDQRPIIEHQVPGWMGLLISLEQAASRLCAFEATTVHGLLQTADYATAVETVGPDTFSNEQVAQHVTARLARQAVLKREPEPLALCVVLDEAVLHRVAGSDETMAEQLDHLVDVGKGPNVEIRVLPLRSGMFVFGSFTLLTQPGASGPFMAFTEDRAGAHYLDRDHDRAAHLELFDHLLELSLDPEATADLISARAKEYRQA